MSAYEDEITFDESIDPKNSMLRLKYATSRSDRMPNLTRLGMMVNLTSGEMGGRLLAFEYDDKEEEEKRPTVFCSCYQRPMAPWKQEGGEHGLGLNNTFTLRDSTSLEQYVKFSAGSTFSVTDGCGLLGSISASLKNTYETAVSSMQDSYCYVDTTVVELGSICMPLDSNTTLLTPEKIAASGEVKLFDKLPLSFTPHSSEQKQYFAFFSAHGTHVCTSAIIGGQRTLTVKINRLSSHFKSADDFAANAAVKVAATTAVAVTANAAASTTSTSRRQSSQDSSSLHVAESYTAGHTEVQLKANDPRFAQANQAKVWEKSVKRLPTILSYLYTPLHWFCRTPERVVAMKDAMKAYQQSIADASPIRMPTMQPQGSLPKVASISVNQWGPSSASVSTAFSPGLHSLFPFGLYHTPPSVTRGYISNSTVQGPRLTVDEVLDRLVSVGYVLHSTTCAMSESPASPSGYHQVHNMFVYTFLLR